MALVFTDILDCTHNPYIIHTNGAKECLRCHLLIIPLKLKPVYPKDRVSIILEEKGD